MYVYIIHIPKQQDETNKHGGYHEIPTHEDAEQDTEEFSASGVAKNIDNNRNNTSNANNTIAMLIYDHDSII